MSDDESASRTGRLASSATPRTYLFALTAAGGTIPPELGVARRLVDRGHSVTVLAEESIADQVRRTGAAYLPGTSGTVDEYRDWELRMPTSLARGMAEHMISGPAPDQARDTTAAIDALRPDLVLASFVGVGAMIGAEARGVPFDALIPNVYPLPADGLPPLGVGLSPARGPLGRLRDRAMNPMTPRLLDRYALVRVNEVRAEYGLEPIATTWGQLQGARRQLILTSAAFDFPATMPDNARYVGPILDDPVWAADADWMAPAGDGPLVLVAMSSTFQNHVDCLQRITDALGGLPVRGVVTTGPAVATNAIHAPGERDGGGVGAAP